MMEVGRETYYGSHPRHPLQPHHHPIDQNRLKKLRLRIDVDDPIHSGLKKLKLKGKDLGHLPEEIFQIDELEVLDLSPERESCLSYRLTYVPGGIGKLLNLKVLMLDTNELQELPNEICLLSSLERFSISNNHLQSLPDAFSSLRQMRSLHAANNKFHKIPISVCDLRELEFLDMSDNQLKQLPTEIAHLRNLKSLIVVFNQIQELPDSICDMRELRVLWLGYNRLKRLPRLFGRLRQLDWGYRHTSSTVIDGNPLQHPPIDVCKRGVEAIEQYFDASEEAEPATEDHRTGGQGDISRNHRTPRGGAQYPNGGYRSNDHDQQGEVTSRERYPEDYRDNSPDGVNDEYDRPRTHVVNKSPERNRPTHDPSTSYNGRTSPTQPPGGRNAYHHSPDGAADVGRPTNVKAPQPTVSGAPKTKASKVKARRPQEKPAEKLY